MGLKYSRWNDKTFRWEIPSFPGNLDLIKDHFHDRINSLIIHKEYEATIGKTTQKIGKEEIVLVKTKNGRVRIIFGFDFELQKKIKTFY